MSWAAHQPRKCAASHSSFLLLLLLPWKENVLWFCGDQWNYRGPRPKHGIWSGLCFHRGMCERALQGGRLMCSLRCRALTDGCSRPEARRWAAISAKLTPSPPAGWLYLTVKTWGREGGNLGPAHQTYPTLRPGNQQITQKWKLHAAIKRAADLVSEDDYTSKNSPNNVKVYEFSQLLLMFTSLQADWS